MDDIRWFDVETNSQPKALETVRAALSDEGFGPDDHTFGAGAVILDRGSVFVRVRATRMTPLRVEQAAKARADLDLMVTRQAVDACHVRFEL